MSELDGLSESFVPDSGELAANESARRLTCAAPTTAHLDDGELNGIMWCPPQAVQHSWSLPVLMDDMTVVVPRWLAAVRVIKMRLRHYFRQDLGRTNTWRTPQEVLGQDDKCCDTSQMIRCVSELLTKLFTVASISHNLPFLTSFFMREDAGFLPAPPSDQFSQVSVRFTLVSGSAVTWKTESAAPRKC